MKQFRLVDNILGWVAFAIAAVVYCSTIEPTASFWDCPEFITTGYKMEIGHPPGAPFFMLAANLFSQFASDPSEVARMVNTMSALLSATCILFLFWSITHLVRRLLTSRGEAISPAKLVTIEASGMVGALIYTFSDTFWFSAVEGEVYAFSSAFTAVVFWLILKWEDHADEPHSDRWLVLIFYMTGLSIGVHLLNLLCLPAIVLVYYYRRFPEANLRGSLVALAISVVLLAAVLYGVVPGIITVGGWFELFFVNVLGMAFNTGVYVYLLLLVGVVLWAIYETQNATEPSANDAQDQKAKAGMRRQNVSTLLAVALLGIPFYGFGWSAVAIGVVVLAALWLLLNYKTGKGKEARPLITARMKNTALLCMLMLMVGYSTYAITVIRSSANPPMDQNSPEDIFTLGDYLSRDQYGSRPLFYGQAYTSQIALEREGNYCRPVSEKGKPVYQRREKASEEEPDEYFVVRTKDEYKYAQNMLFPRMYSSAYAQQYENWLGGVKGHEEPYDRCGETIMVKVPSQWDNLRFFVSYQCNWMYWRYFLWNFAGRQNDIQGHGEPEHGNWLTGFSFIDNARLGDQSKLPDELKKNKGHNVFYCLPLLLGLLGLFWQASYDERTGRRNPSDKKKKAPWGTQRISIGGQQFWVVFFLFFLTGLAIVVYLNQTPQQPRERDYAYAGSFYAFAIWCGMGVAAITDWIGRKMKKESLALTAVIGCAALLVPMQMASETWDDHDRSGRYTCRDYGQNYLMSLQQSVTDADGNEVPSYPIVYTNGDNDTFPLWYNQDTEGVRTDARVCNLSYLQTDWYIDQMVRPAYDSPALPITWKRIEYCAGTNEYVQVDPKMKQEVLQFYRDHPAEAKAHFGEEPFELKNILDNWVRAKDPDLHVIPTDTIYLTIDKEAVRRSGMMMAADSIPDRMVISLANKSALYKGDLMMLEMIAHANWTRPIYVATTVGAENYMNLGDNFVQEGLANRITPFTTKGADTKNFDTEKVYQNVTKRFKWGNVKQPGIYLDETVTRMCYTHRRLLAFLALHLAQEGDTARTAEVLALSEREIPVENVNVDYTSGSLDMVRAYAAIGDKKNAERLLNLLWEKSLQYLTYYTQLPPHLFNAAKQECYLHLYVMQHAAELCAVVNPKLAEKYSSDLNNAMLKYEQRGGGY